MFPSVPLKIFSDDVGRWGLVPSLHILLLSELIFVLTNDAHFSFLPLRNWVEIVHMSLCVCKPECGVAAEEMLCLCWCVCVSAGLCDRVRGRGDAWNNAPLRFGMFILECHLQSNLTFITGLPSWLSGPQFKCPRINKSALNGRLW